VLLFEIAELLGFLGLFLLCGVGIVEPFRPIIRYWPAAATFLGSLVLPCLTLLIHVVSRLLFSTSLLAAILVLFLLGAPALLRCIRDTRPTADLIAPAIFSVALAAAVCFMYLRYEILSGDRALVFFSGTDQFGYAHLAEWLKQEPANVPRQPTPDDPWGSWVNLIVTFDPRFGSFSYLALVSTISRRSEMFSYNLASAIAMASASLGLAGLFARTRVHFVLIAAFTLTSYWFSVSMAGFFGKIVGLPAILFCVGLLLPVLREMISKREAVLTFRLISLVAVTVCASLMYSASAVATAIVACGFAYVALLILLNRESFGTFNLMLSRPVGLGSAAVLTIAILAVLAGGTIARPLYLIGPKLEMDGASLLYGITQVSIADMQLSIFPYSAWPALAAIALLSVGAIAFTSWRQGSAEALAILGGFTGIGAALVLTGRTWEFYQSLTVYLPAAICAASYLTEAGVFVSFLITAAMIVGSGRFLATVELTPGANMNPVLIVAKEETDRVLEAAKGTGGAYLDTSSVYSTYPLILELHRRGLKFQLSPRAWNSMLSYRPWSPPAYPVLLAPKIADGETKDRWSYNRLTYTIE
jgi:hypothetical protein